MSFYKGYQAVNRSGDDGVGMNRIKLVNVKKEIEGIQYVPLEFHQKAMSRLLRKIENLKEYYMGDGRCKKCDGFLMPPSCPDCDFK